MGTACIKNQTQRFVQRSIYFIHLGSKGSCSDDYNDEDDKCQHHWQEGHLVAHKHVLHTALKSLNGTYSCVTQSHLPFRVSLCFGKAREAAWMQQSLAGSQSYALPVCYRDQLRHNTEDFKHSNVLHDDCFIWDKTKPFQHTPWHSLEHFSQCVTSRDVVADHSWRTKQRKCFILLWICSVIKTEPQDSTYKAVNNYVKTTIFAWLTRSLTDERIKELQSR